MQFQGLQLKEGIKNKGLTQDQAAKKLGMTRQNLALYYDREFLPKDLLQDVKEKLDIQFSSENNRHLDEILKSKIETIESLKETVQSQKTLIESLQAQLSFYETDVGKKAVARTTSR